MLFFFGIEIPVPFQGCCWSNQFIQWLKQCAQQTRLHKAGLGFFIEQLSYLRALNLSITRQIKELSQSSRYKTQVDLLITIPGIGMLTAMKYLTEMGPINRFPTLDKHASFIGLVPNMHNSADKERIGPMTKRGNDFVKTALIESAWIAKRTDPALALKYEQLIRRMKPSKAIVIIAKKLLNRIRFVLKNQLKYQNHKR
jgi:transposase